MSTAIQWTDETWNPIVAFDRATGKRGWFCVHASTGCLNCYAEAVNTFRGNGHKYRVGEQEKVRFDILDSVLTQPLHWRKRRRVFPCSMTDLFFDAHTDEMLGRVFAVMALTPQHTYQVLTKRSARMRAYMTTPNRKRLIAEQVMYISNVCAAAARSHTARVSLDHFSECFAGTGPFPNVWLGVSTENQKAAEERIPLLLGTPAAVRFLSCEPLLGPIDLTSVSADVDDEAWADVLRGHFITRHTDDDDIEDQTRMGSRGVDWVIVGGESGPKARPLDVRWVRDIVAQCRAAGVAPFVKQLGSEPGFRLEDEEARGNVAPSFHHYDAASGLYIKKLDDSHGGDPAQWPDDLRVREFPERAV